jgi:hypothetical protein
VPSTMFIRGVFCVIGSLCSSVLQDVSPAGDSRSPFHD